MKKLAVSILLTLVASTFAGAQKASRGVAFTVDDLPAVSTRNDIVTRRGITTNILRRLVKSHAPVVGFVNEGQVTRNGGPVDEQVDLLRQWLAAGFELGNHTFSHMSLFDNPLEVYEEDILRGEVVTKQLLAAKGMKIRYFRHPYLWTGLSMEIKSELGAFLAQHGYTIAPVTIDNSDWIFARAYDNALDRKDSALAKSILDAYVPYLEFKTEYWERQSVKLFGREINQILLLHSNRLNARAIDRVASMYKKRGYRFLTLDEALADEAYKLPDTFVRRNGISWLHRWAIARGAGNVLPDEPKVPEFVLKSAGVESE